MSAHREAAQRRLMDAGHLLNEAAREIARWAGEASEPSRSAFVQDPRYGEGMMMAQQSLADRTKFAQHVEQRALELLQAADSLAVDGQGAI